jgi:hypothetical protein
MMGKDKPKVQLLLEAVFVGAVDKLLRADSGQVISAFHVQLDMATGEIAVYDDREVLLEKTIIFEWAEQSAKNPRLVKQAVHFIRVALQALRARKIFDNQIFDNPFSVILVDDIFNEIETVYTYESADEFSEGRLMKNLEQDLKIFSKKIFAD